jgi:hypothetical protein
MKKILTSAVSAAFAIGFAATASAATIVYDFNSNDGVVASNDFGSGVTVSDWTIVSGGGSDFNASTWDALVADGMARGAARKASQGGITMSFTVTIDASTTIDLTGVTWENGMDTNGATMTPLWSLAITGEAGTATPASGTNANITASGFYGENKAAALSNLTGLTDTTVTFTWDMTQEQRANSVNIIANTMDDVVLTGTVVPEPSSAALLLGLVGLGFLARRRR